MEDAPPAFQEASRCAICASGFSTFRRRHHCRCCGRSLCNEHSSNQMALPQFGLKSAVRVCDDCFQSPQKQPTEVRISQVEFDDSRTSSSFAKLSLSPSSSPPLREVRSIIPETQILECTCGMPLCICQAPTPSQVISSTEQVTPFISKKNPSSSSFSNPTAAKPSASSSFGNNLPSLFFSTTQMANGGSHNMSKKHEATGEGMREAIKVGDAASVKDLLASGVNPNHTDKQGMSLLHLAAVFNLTEIAFLLMDAGAKADAKNSQGETPLDCAQATLQFKMQRKIKAEMKDL